MSTAPAPMNCPSTTRHRKSVLRPLRTKRARKVAPTVRARKAAPKASTRSVLKGAAEGLVEAPIVAPTVGGIVVPGFQDIHPEFNKTNDIYLCTNEAPEDLLALTVQAKGDRTSIPLAGSIASGGEIPYLVLLPHCDEVVCVDHSIPAIIACYIKGLLLQKLGAQGFLDFLKRMKTCTGVLAFRGSPALPADRAADRYYPVPAVLARKPNPLVKEWIETLRSVEGLLPPSLKAHFKNYDDVALDVDAPHPDKGGYPSKLYNMALINTIQPSHASTWHSEWSRFSIEHLELVRSRLDRVSFVHGDFRDLAKLGRKFDLLYISNMCGHTGRDGKSPKMSELTPLVNEGAHILSTKFDTYYAQMCKGWKSLKKLRTRTSWEHHLCTQDVPEKKAS